MNVAQLFLLRLRVLRLPAHGEHDVGTGLTQHSEHPIAVNVGLAVDGHHRVVPAQTRSIGGAAGVDIGDDGSWVAGGRHQVIIVPKIVLVELNVVQEAQPERLFGARRADDGEMDAWLHGFHRGGPP